MIKNTEKKIYILSLEMDSEHIKKKYSDLSEDNRIIIDDTALITHSQLCANLNGIPDLGAVIIDYFQLINTDSRVCGQKEIVRELKQIATELDIPVICTSQFPSITEEQRKNYRLVLSNLNRYSGGYVQDADVVLFLHRDTYYGIVEPLCNDMAEIVVAKNCYGDCKILPFNWSVQQLKFLEE